jgi:hypothetical protein
MRREAAGHVATAAMTDACGLWPFDASKRGKREDDDDDASVTQSGPHLAVTPGGARLVAAARAAAGPANGPKAVLGEMGGWRPAVHSVVSQFSLRLKH